MIILACRRTAIRAMITARVMVICAASILNHEEGVDFLEARVCGFGVAKVEDLDYRVNVCQFCSGLVGGIMVTDEMRRNRLG